MTFSRGEGSIESSSSGVSGVDFESKKLRDFDQVFEFSLI